MPMSQVRFYSGRIIEASVARSPLVRMANGLLYRETGLAVP